MNLTNVQPRPLLEYVQSNLKSRIFVSSTYDDLREEREAIEQALLHMRSTTFFGMEYFGSQPTTPKAFCLDLVSKSNVYIGIFAHRYGYIDPETGLSMTELEYRKAQECKIPCLIYMIDENVPVLPKEFEDDPKKIKKLKALKEELRGKQMIYFFKSSTDLVSRMMVDLHCLLLSYSFIAT